MKKRDKMATGSDVAKQPKIEGVRSVADWDGLVERIRAENRKLNLGQSKRDTTT